MKPLVLCIGGTAPNGPGLAADEEAVLAAGGRFACAATAHTQQDEAGVQELGARPGWQWRYEALAALAVENPGALKTGLLPGVEHLTELRGLLGQLRFDAPGLPWVLDPVVAASSGHVFLDAGALEVLLGLLELGPVVCPNLGEAAALTGVALEVLVEDPAARLLAAQRLLERGAEGVVLKAGHGAEDPLRELVWARGEGPRWLARPRVAGSIRGSGCRHAAHLATGLAKGLPLERAADEAGRWVASLLV